MKDEIMTLLFESRRTLSLSAMRRAFKITDSEADRPRAWRLSQALAELYYRKFITYYITPHGRYARAI